MPTETCYLKATRACVGRNFEIPEEDKWIYAATSSLLVFICGDCRMFVKAKVGRPIPSPLTV